MRKILSLICCACLIFATSGVITGAEEFFEFDVAEKPLSVTYNGDEIHFSDVQPEIMGGRTMVPLRAVFERVGCEVLFENGEIIAKRENHTVQLAIGNETAQVERDGKSETYTLDAVPVIVNGRTLVPVRFIAETLGCQTNWNPNMREVVIIDVDAWRGQVEKEAPLVDFLFSMQLRPEEAFLSKGSGTINGKVALKDTEISFSARLEQEILSDVGNKEISSKIEIKFDGLKEYAAQLESGSRKEALRRLASRSGLTIDAVIDSEYNLYVSGDGVVDVLAIFSQGQRNGVLDDRTLKIPAGAMLSDATGLPLGTILQAETVWDGLNKAIREDEHIFTQSAKTMDNAIQALIQCMGGTKTEESDDRAGEETAHYISNEDAPLYEINFVLQDSDITKWMVTAADEITIPGNGERDDAVNLDWEVTFSANRSKAGNRKVSVPDDVLDWEIFIKSTD